MNLLKYISGRFFAILLGSPLIFLGGCEPQELKPPVQWNASHSDVLVLCEGNFMWGNARLDMLQMDSMKLLSDVYKSANGASIGDVLQHGVFWGNSYYLSVNNSGVVVKLRAGDLKIQALNPQMGSPRYLMKMTDKLWVTDLYGNKISLLDTTTLEVKKTISITGWTEQMVLWNGAVYVANYGGGVYGFTTDGNPATYPKLQTDSATQYVAVDKLNRLWVMSTQSGKGKLYRFDAANQTTPNKIIDLGEDASKLTMNAAGDTMYFLTPTAVKKMAIDVVQSTDIQLVVSGLNQAYALGISPGNDFLLVGEANDYVSNGKVTVMNLKTGSVVKSFSTGVNPTAFVFKP